MEDIFAEKPLQAYGPKTALLAAPVFFAGELNDLPASEQEVRDIDRFLKSKGFVTKYLLNTKAG
jgi:hypothetical protein